MVQLIIIIISQCFCYGFYLQVLDDADILTEELREPVCLLNYNMLIFKSI